MISYVARCKWLLMVFGEYAYGDHVSDPQAFVLRWRRLWYG